MTSPRLRASIALTLALLGCAPPREDPLPTDAPAVVTDAPAMAVDATAALADAPAVVTDAPAAAVDACDLRAEVALRLRAPATMRTLATLPAGTALELLAVTRTTRGPADRLGVLSRVRVRETGAEGMVFLGAEALRRCQEQSIATPDVAESRTVVVDGVAETWRVRFVDGSRAPAAVAEAERTCADDFAAGFDRGRAVIERLRDGVVIDRFENPCAREDGDECARGVMVPWRVGSTGPRATLLDVGDYDHDGAATELALDVGFLVCGHAMSAVVGVTRANPRLHVLRWADGDRMALTTGRAAWEAVRASPRGEAVTWRCGDHGSTDEERVRWWPSGTGLAREETLTAMDASCRALTEEPEVLETGE